MLILLLKKQLEDQFQTSYISNNIVIIIALLTVSKSLLKEKLQQKSWTVPAKT